MFPDYFRDDVFRLETQRLWLRWPTAADAAAIEKLAGAREVAEVTARIPHPYPAGGGQTFVIDARRGNCDGESLQLTLAPLAKPGSMIGMIALRGNGEEVELGYWLGAPHWGAGLMSEAVSGLLDFVWLATDIERVVATASLLNLRSQRVLERAGFVAQGEALIEAPARGGPVPGRRYTLPRTTPRFGALPGPRLSSCGAGR